jgi:uncharacterized membrane protein YsdA (DUF1294 family)
MPRRNAPRRLDTPSAVVLGAFALGYLVVALVRGVPPWVHLLYAGASVLCFALYAADKGAARAGRDRISESMLLSLGLVGGWPGAIVAQQALRHKTVKRAFRLRFWLSVATNVAVFAWLAAVARSPA